MRILLIALLMLLVLPVKAEPNRYASGTFWTKLKVQVQKHLSKKLSSGYKYEIIGPTRELKNFLGNRADAIVKFDKLLLSSPSPRKSLIAYVENANGKRIDSVVIQIDLWVYDNVYMLRKAVNRGGELDPQNIYQTRYPVRQMDQRMFFKGNLKQKVATTYIPAKSPIKVNMIRHQKIVQIGDMIKVSSGSKFISLEFFCKAMNSADIGDVINITCPEMNKKNHRAEIIAPAQARLL